MPTRTWHQHEQVWVAGRGWRCVEKCVACQQTEMFYPGKPLSEHKLGKDNNGKKSANS